MTTHCKLLRTDRQSSARAIGDPAGFMAYGFSPEGMRTTRLGYRGELYEARVVYSMGAGYRLYHPELMRFGSADVESPFRRGGVNAYAYCAGDPVNRIDPDGRSWRNYRLEAGMGMIAVGGGLMVSSALVIASGGSRLARGYSGEMEMGAGLGMFTAGLGLLSRGISNVMDHGIAQNGELSQALRAARQERNEFEITLDYERSRYDSLQEDFNILSEQYAQLDAPPAYPESPPPPYSRFMRRAYSLSALDVSSIRRVADRNTPLRQS